MSDYYLLNVRTLWGQKLIRGSNFPVMQICLLFLSFLCKILPLSSNTRLHSIMALCRVSKSNWRVYRLSHGALNIVRWDFCNVRYCCIS